MLNLKRTFCCVVVATAMTASVAFAQPGRGNSGGKLTCFVGGSGTDIGECSLANGRSTAMLNAFGADVDGSFAGVFSSKNNIAGDSLAELSNVKFSFTGTGVGFGPQFRLPIDTDGDGLTNLRVFIPGELCDDGAGNVDVTGSPSCFLFILGGTSEAIPYSDFQVRYPNSRIATDVEPSIHAVAGTWVISNVLLGLPGNR